MNPTAGAGRSPEEPAYQELQCYTLAHRGPEFIHQHVVDAWTAQHADRHTKPIGLTFALVGLYLHLEGGFTGRQVQRAHMAMGRRQRTWPSFALPSDRGRITACEVMAAPAGAQRDQAISAWCRSVWEAYQAHHQAVADLVRDQGVR